MIFGSDGILEKGRLVCDLTKGPFGAINEVCSVRVIAFIGGDHDARIV